MSNTHDGDEEVSVPTAVTPHDATGNLQSHYAHPPPPAGDEGGEEDETYEDADGGYSDEEDDEQADHDGVDEEDEEREEREHNDRREEPADDEEDDDEGDEEDEVDEADEEEEADEDAGGGVKSSDGQALIGRARTQRSAHVIDTYSPPAVEESGANGSAVLSYFRHFVQQFNITPPREWRQIRFDLPATVADLRLYAPSTEQTQHKRPILPTTTIVLQLQGLMPADTSVEDYMTQMTQYLFDVLKYVDAMTAMTSVRFVKKGAIVTQMVVTLGRDRILASRVLKQVRAAGIPAGYGLPTHDRDMQPNATFQIRDYKFLLNDGRGISAEDVKKFLTPFRVSAHDDDIIVIDGFEPGLYFAPVKRPESVFSFLWNPAVSILMQRFLFEKLGVLITQASCPHEFLQKGIPYHIQKQQKELEKQMKLEEKAKKSRAADEKASAAARNRQRGGDNGDEGEDGEQARDEYKRSTALPMWARQAEQAVDIFNFDAVVDDNNQGSAEHALGTALKQVLKTSAPAAPAPVATATNTTATASSLAPPMGSAPYGPGQPSFGPYDTPAYMGPYPGAPQPMLPGQPPYYGSGAGPVPYGQGGVPPQPPAPYDNEEDDDDDGEGNALTASSGTRNTASATDSVKSTGPAVPVRRYQLAKLDPSQDLDEDEGRSATNSGSLFFTDMASTLGSTDLFRHLLEPRKRAAKTDAATAVATTAAPDTSTPAGPEARAYAVQPVPEDTSGARSTFPPPPSSGYGYDMAPPFASDVYSHSAHLPHQSGRGGAESGAPLFGAPPAAVMDSSHSYNVHGGHDNGEMPYGGREYGHDEAYPYYDPTQGSYMGPPLPHQAPYGVQGGDDTAYPQPPPPTGNTYTYGEPGYGFDSYYGSGVLGAPSMMPVAPVPYGEPDEGAMLPAPSAPATEITAVGGGSILGNAYMQPATMSPEVADRLVVTVEEHLRNSFPNEFDAYMARVQGEQYLQADGLESEPLDEAANRACLHVPIMSQIAPESASLPYRSDELDALTTHIENEYTRIVQLLGSRYIAALDEPRRRLLRCLFFALPAEAQADDWRPRVAEDDDDEEEEEPKEKKDGDHRAIESRPAQTSRPPDKKKAAYLPALLPYCLASDEGTEVVRTLTQLYPRHVTPLVARYVLPFLLDSNVVSAVCVPLLYQDPRAENPLCARILQHWSSLTAWLQRYTVAQSVKDAQMQLEHESQNKTDSDVAAPPSLSSVPAGDGAPNADGDTANAAALATATNAVRKRLVSQVGNTLEQVLAAMSLSQRVAARHWNDTYTLLDHAFSGESPAAKPEDGKDAHAIAAQTVDLAVGMWSDEGAVTRTLLRLYLAADTFDGRHLLEVLHKAFHRQASHGAQKTDTSSTSAAHALHSESFFYFARALIAPIRGQVGLSRETSAFCGAYVRTVERLLRCEPANADATPPAGFHVGEKELVQLMSGAVHALEEASAAAGQAAYLNPTAATEVTTAAVALEALKVAYNNPLSFEDAKAGASSHLAAVQATLANARVMAPLPTPPPVQPFIGAGPGLMPIPQAGIYPGALQPQPTTSLLSFPPPAQAQLSAGALPPPPPSPLATLEARWQLEWTRKMSLYPLVEEPFTPLPTGWTSALSRSYGHYYFKPPGTRVSPTYRHPTDKTEFMATPQAFLREPGTSLKLEEVRRRANALIAEALAQSRRAEATVASAEAEEEIKDEMVSAEAAAAWFADQRTRQIGLDVATLDLLSIHYRLGGQRRTQREDAPSAAGAGGQPAVSRRVEHTEAELAAILDRSITARRHYPVKGYPFPGLFKGWTVNMSALNGLYTFQPPRAPDPTIRHPQNRQYYRASPQAFAEHRGITADAIAEATKGEKTVADVEAWMADQRKRDRLLDKTLCDMVKIHYMGIPDIDEPRAAGGTGGARQN